MKKGGYKIIDFKGTALSGTAEEITGIYEDIVNNYDKAILVSGVSLNESLQDDAYASVKVNDGSVALTVYDGVITVTEDDEITFASASSNAKLTEDVASIMSKAVMKTSVSTITADLNDAVEGWAYYGGSSTNLPASATPCFVLTLFHQSFKCQLAIARNTSVVYTRTFSTDTWSEWKQATNA